MTAAMRLTSEPARETVEEAAAAIRGCRLCRDAPRFGPPLPQEPRPIVQMGRGARLCIASQAPGTLAHASGRPFMDPSGRRLRAWLGLDEDVFYDPTKVAIVPMGACFPGQDAKGGDLPPRRECAPTWRDRLFATLPDLELVLMIGHHAQRWHLGAEGAAPLTQLVGRWREIVAAPRRPRLLPTPHPSWRNNHWLRANPWFEAECLPVLRQEVARLVGPR